MVRLNKAYNIDTNIEPHSSYTSSLLHMFTTTTSISYLRYVLVVGSVMTG